MKVAAEAAAAEFERWAELFEIDTSTDGLGPDEIKVFEAFRKRFVERVVKGAIAVDDDGVITFTPRGDSGDPLKFDEPTGALLSSRLKNDSDVQAARRALAAWANVPASRFSNMKLRDFNFCAELLAFFSNS